MTNALTTLQNSQLPAHLQQASQFLALNDAAVGGIKAGGFPSISIKGAKFHIKDPAAENPFVTITVDLQGTQVPAPYLDLVVIAANPDISKKYYAGAYDDSDDDKSPDCSSENGQRPDAHITSPVHTACATCPKNQWGSKITPQGKETKACSDSKRLVILPAADLKFKALALDVTPAALKEYGAYIRTLSARNVPVIGVVTRVKFDPTAAFPKLQFEFLRFLSAEEFAQVQSRIDSDEVRNIVAPKRVPVQQPAVPAPQPTVTMPDATAHNMAAAVSAAAANAVANAPVTDVDKAAAAAAAKVIQFPNPTAAAPAAPPAEPTVSLGGGGAPAEPKKRGRPKTETPAPAAGTVDAVTAAAAAATVGADPFDVNTVPEPYKAAIIAAGGAKSPGGQAIYNAMPKAAAPAPQPTAFSQPPAGTTVASGQDLGAALANLLGGKK